MVTGQFPIRALIRTWALNRAPRPRGTIDSRRRWIAGKPDCDLKSCWNDFLTRRKLVGPCGHSFADAMGLPREIVKRTLGAAVRLRGRLTLCVGNLGVQNVHLANFGSLCEKVGSFSHQRSGHFA